MRKAGNLIILILGIVLLDQWSKLMIINNYSLGESKSIIDNILNFTFVVNKGAAFSFAHDFSDTTRLIMLKILPIFICFYIAYLIIKEYSSKMSYVYAMILGGAIGNLIDRIRLNYVVDFIDVYHKDWHYATFNVADSFVFVGGVLLFIMLFKKEKV